MKESVRRLKARPEASGVLPQNEAVYRCDCAGEPSAKLPDSNPVKTALRGILETLAL